MSLFAYLLKPNALCRIELVQTTREADSGGEVETYTTLRDQVPCLVSQTNGSRDRRFESDAGALSGTVSGDVAEFARADVRLYFYTGPAAGKYARIDTPGRHGPAPPGSWITAWSTAKWSQIRIGD